MSKTMGFRFSPEQLDRLDRLARSMGVSRNRAVNLLIESAAVTPMVVSVNLKKNTHSAEVLAGQSAMGVL